MQNIYIQHTNLDLTMINNFYFKCFQNDEYLTKYGKNSISFAVSMVLQQYWSQNSAPSLILFLGLSRC
jgi:hypothetical protein